MISVCMASYNGERFIKQQIDSILSQLSSNDELIISDDGSTDNTLEIINSYKDRRIRLLHHKKINSKYYKNSVIPVISFNFENALNHVNGDYIFLTDQDDIWYENKIFSCVNILKQYTCILSNFSIIDDNNNVKKLRYYKKNPLFHSLIKSIIEPHFIGCCMCFTKDLLHSILPFPKSVCSHDLWIGLNAIKKNSILYYDFPLVYHRIGISNNSTACKVSKNALLMRIKYRWYMLIEILKKRNQ